MNWLAHKNRLHQRGLLDRCFLTDAHSVLTDSVLPAQEVEVPSPYWPSSFDLLLRDLASICDRMTVYVKELRELEVQAVKSATDRMVHTESRVFERQLTTLQLGQKLSQLSATLSREVAGKFLSNDALAPGFNADALLKAQTSELEGKLAEEQLELLTLRWNLADQVSDDYWGRHSTPGNAHNYVERWGWINRLLLEDAIEARQKALSVRSGLEILHQEWVPAPPEVGHPGYVETMTLWTRARLRDLQLLEQADQEFELVVPLVQPTSPLGRSLIEAETFADLVRVAASTPGTPLVVGFDLPEEMFDAKRIRLRSMALSFSTQSDVVDASGIDRTSQRLSYARLSGTVTLPDQRGRRGAAGPEDNKVLFGSISAYGAPNALVYASGRPIHNAEILGTWSIQIAPLALFQDNQACLPLRDLGSYNVTDLRIHLRGVCQA